MHLKPPTLPTGIFIKSNIHFSPKQGKYIVDKPIVPS